MDKFEQLYRKLEALSGNVSVYMMGGYTRRENVEETPEYRFGFNDGQSEIIDGVFDLLRSAEEDISPEETVFYSDDEWTFLRVEGKWHVRLNDTWYYSCGDWEEIEPEEYKEVVRWYRLYGRAGVLYWVWKNKRDHLPTIPEYRKQVEAISGLVEPS